MRKQNPLLTSLRTAVANAHVHVALRWPTLLAIAAGGLLRRKRPSTTVRSILLVRLDGLGDCILTLPLAEALGRCFPGARFSVLTQPSAAPLFQALPQLHEVLTMPLPFSRRIPKYLRSLAAAVRMARGELWRRRFDAVVMPRWDLDIYHATFLCALLRSPIAVGYTDSTSADKFALNRGFEDAWTHVLPPGPLQHEVLRNLEAVRALGCNPGPAALHLPLEETHREAAARWLGEADTGYIGVGLSSAEAKKRWPPDRYIEALREIRQRSGLTPVLFADGETSSTAQAIHHALPECRVAQQMPLLQVAAVLQRCRVFLGNDSGLGHLAAAVNCPTVTIFSQSLDTTGEHASRHSTNPERFRPFGPHTVALQPEVAQAGCLGGCQALEPHCILGVSAGRAAAAVLELLARTGRQECTPTAPADTPAG